MIDFIWCSLKDKIKISSRFIPDESKITPNQSVWNVNEMKGLLWIVYMIVLLYSPMSLFHVCLTFLLFHIMYDTQWIKIWVVNN